MKNKIELIIKPRVHDIGIPVRRILPYAKKRMIGPFIFLDHMGPAFMKAPDDHMDVRPHPHIGLSTLTYLFEGKIMHRDSLGVEQLIEPGQVNWMTAGKGISHSEREPSSDRTINRTIHGLQFWVALPTEHEDVAPSFYHYGKEDIPEWDVDGLSVKLVAGSAFSKTSKLKAYSPMTFMVMTASREGRFSFPEIKGHEHAIYVVKGKVSLSEEVTVGETELVVFEKNSSIELSHSEDAVFALIGGEPFPEPRFIWWNLVSSSREKIVAAKEQWIAGTFPQVPGDHEKIPAPTEPQIPMYP